MTITYLSPFSFCKTLSTCFSSTDKSLNIGLENLASNNLSYSCLQCPSSFFLSGGELSLDVDFFIGDLALMTSGLIRVMFLKGLDFF